MKLLLVYYGSEQKPPRLFFENDSAELIDEIVHLTKKKALFAVYEVGECIGDFS